jgi:GPH family glycoside/pentoside/hexuronide:cation symporter
MDPPSTKGLPTGKRIAYAAPAFALAVVGIPIYVYIPKFYTDVVGVSMASLGFLILAARLFDAFTDPVVGLLSDRTRIPLGRRRPYIFFGSLILALSIYFLFNPPETSPSLETWWFGVWIFSVFLFWTVVAVPYESLGPELTFDYHERTVLFGLRDGALIAGTLVAASSPSLAGWILGGAGGAAAERTKFFWISAAYSPLVVIFCLWCVLAIRERDRPLRTSSGPAFLEGLKITAHNRPFLILLLSYTIAAFGSNLPATLILYYVQYVLQSTHAEFFLLLYFVAGIVFLPGWVRLSRKLGKKTTWIVSMALNTLAFMGVFFLGSGDAVLYGVLVFFSGIGFGATIAIPSAMQADVIDYDEFMTGERREGLYIGLWSVTKKLAAALGVGIALSVLGGAGYRANVEQTASVQTALRVLYALVPSLCNGVAIVIAMAYPINRKAHEAILGAVEARKAGRSVENPLYPRPIDS